MPIPTLTFSFPCVVQISEHCYLLKIAPTGNCQNRLPDSSFKRYNPIFGFIQFPEIMQILVINSFYYKNETTQEDKKWGRNAKI